MPQHTQKMMPSKVRTVAEVASLQAKAMLTTARVGDPGEDAEMAVMRPMLSRVNFHGLVTVDSQMGHKRPKSWQRAYVSGFVAKALAPAIISRLIRQDGMMVLQFPHGETMARHLMIGTPKLDLYGYKHMPRLPVTLDGADLVPVTRMPLAIAQTWSEMWMNLLPEIDMRDDKASQDAVMQDAVQVYIVDLTWGRRTWLFTRIIKVLRTIG